MPWWGRWSTESNEKILIREKIKFDSLRSFWFNLEVNRSHIRTSCVVQTTLQYTQTDQSRLVHMHLDNLRDKSTHFKRKTFFLIVFCKFVIFPSQLNVHYPRYQQNVWNRLGMNQLNKSPNVTNDIRCFMDELVLLWPPPPPILVRLFYAPIIFLRQFKCIRVLSAALLRDNLSQSFALLGVLLICPWYYCYCCMWNIINIHVGDLLVFLHQLHIESSNQTVSKWNYWHFWYVHLNNDKCYVKIWIKYT